MKNTKILRKGRLMMNLQEFCRPFDKPLYGLNGVHSKKDVIKFFIDTAFGYDSNYDDSYYRKWFGGDEFTHWDTVQEKLNVDKFADELRQCMNLDARQKLCEAFGVRVDKDEDIDEYALSYALAVQFKEIAAHKGNADNNVNKVYREYDRGDLYKNYIKKAIKSYRWMSIHDGEEGELDDYYVCNTLSFNSPTIAPSKPGKVNEAVIDDATLDKLMTYRKNRTGSNNNNSMLIGNGGIGKTLMLQNLFLEAARRYSETRLVPVIVSLREVALGDDDLVPCITKAFKHFDSAIELTDVEALMHDGRCQLLLDGLDEIDETYVKQFQKQLQETIDKYDEIQVVLATRECAARKGIRRFSKFYLIEFNPTQTEQLVMNLLGEDGAEEEKKQIMDFIYNGFLEKSSVFVKNPMLITFIVENRDKLQSYLDNHYEFYEQSYKTILEGHDANKNAYDRIFHSVDDAEDFTNIFREFCAISYMDKVFQFDNDSFEEYFRRLKTVDELPNKHKIKKSTFYHDVCATACMMYEENSKILYIDQGFQEYLFVAYYRAGNTDIGKLVGRTLMTRSLKDYKNRNAFDMLMDSSEEKMEICLFKPFLDSVFRGRDDEQAFKQFIIIGYDRLHYSVINETLLMEYQAKVGCGSSARIECVNEPKTVILSMLLEKLGEPDSFSLSAEENPEGCDEFSKMSIIADKEDDADELLMRVVSQGEFEKRDSFERLRNVKYCIRDDNEQIVCFGHEYEVDTFTIGTDTDRFVALLSLVKTKNESVVKTFEKIKEYYGEINRNQYKNKFK